LRVLSLITYYIITEDSLREYFEGGLREVKLIVTLLTLTLIKVGLWKQEKGGYIFS
jgi:hypothetical protein